MTNINDTETMSREQLLKYAQDLASLNQDMKKESRQLIKYAEDLSILYEDSKKKRKILQKTQKELSENYYSAVLMGFDLMSLSQEALGAHCKRVSYYAERLAIALKLSGRSITNIKLGALLHDIGLTGIPKKDLNDILSGQKNRFLKIYKDHPLVNVRPITSSDRFRQASNIIKTHHENINGSGFPHGLKNESIPVETRLVTVADGYDTIKMSSSKEITPEKIFKIMEKDIGIKYDKMVFQKFKDMLSSGDPLLGSMDLKIKDLKPGMVIAEPLELENGLTLLSPDTILTKRHIASIVSHQNYGALRFAVRVYKSLEE